MTLNSPNPDGDTPNTVILRGMDELEYKEAPADGTSIRPGTLVERSAGGIVPHGTAAGEAAPYFAVERRKVGMLADATSFPQELSSDVNATYEAGILALFAGFDKGHQVWGLGTAGVNIPDNTLLVSNGDGTLRPINTNGATGETESGAIVKSIEAVDLSGAADPGRVRMEIVE